MRLRPATIDDVDTLFDIRCSVVENHQSREELERIGVTPESVRAMIEGGDYVAVVAEAGKRDVGFAMAQISQGYVFACFVRPECEKKGIGGALMRAVEDGLRKAGVRQAWLLTGAAPDLRAAGFYRHLGWKENGERDDGQIKFRKSLQERQR